jgi:hypothetical protein
VIARVPAALRDGPSVTMVVGRYGDVVIRPHRLFLVVSGRPARLDERARSAAGVE